MTSIQKMSCNALLVVMGIMGRLANSLTQMRTNQNIHGSLRSVYAIELDDTAGTTMASRGVLVKTNYCATL